MIPFVVTWSFLPPAGQSCAYPLSRQEIPLWGSIISLCCLVHVWAAIQLLSLWPCFSPHIWAGTMSFYTVPCFCVNTILAKDGKPESCLLRLLCSPIEQEQQCWCCGSAPNQVIAVHSALLTHPPQFQLEQLFPFFFPALSSINTVAVELLVWSLTLVLCFHGKDRHPHVHTWTVSPLAQTDVVP